MSEPIIRDLVSHEDHEQCLVLQRDTWGRDCRELVPPAILMIARKMGGMAAGAFLADGTLAGFVFGLSGIYEGRPAHWSHMLAVRPEHRDRGIGRTLKEHQRRTCAALGISTIIWTFDPLVARNAHLNLNRLGARIVEYVPDMYGADPTSVMDQIIGSDRFVVTWSTAPAASGPAPSPSTPTARVSGPEEPSPFPGGPSVELPIPSDIQRLKQTAPGEARRWRAFTRRAFQHYLTGGYRVTGFRRERAERCCYRLDRPA